jgi:hypothetical protein
MLTMKQHLALITIVAAAACHAQMSLAGQPAAALAAVSGQKPAPAAAPHQLSAEQRAELRRQLSQFSRVAGKGP